MSAPSAAGTAAGSPGQDVKTQVVVLGGGPGGYTAAFRAADLGLEVVLVERHETLGGVCLNVGCIPSKALLHVAKVIADAAHAAEHGVSFGAPAIDLPTLRASKQATVSRLTSGLAGMASKRGVRVLHGEAQLTGTNSLQVGDETVVFEHAILATGSRAMQLPELADDDALVIDSTRALELLDVPPRLLVIGGGIIGLELATVYDALGSKITVVELAEQLMPGCDTDLLQPLSRRIRDRYAAIHLNTRVSQLEPDGSGLRATFAVANPDLADAPEPAVFDRVLVAVGRIPNGDGIGLEQVGVATDERGFVIVDSQQRTSVPHIYAIGDLTGFPMLAHKATHEAKIAAEVIAGQDVEFDVRGIPSVAYTNPEIAWVGLTEEQAKRTATPYRKVTFPWSASGRALASDAANGITKLLVEPDSNRLLGAGIAGTGAGELIAATGLALELQTDTQDIALTVHPHPTLSETVALAAEMAEGTITDLPAAAR